MKVAIKAVILLADQRIDFKKVFPIIILKSL